ncbi:unnamed protein product [Meganyctiphanes norvegica]|uniref:non-specific serine/threonine protein kinase n=1 Tax=Meganyctiphanes norvegica TaxID=48144 RepID=A0AAV2SF78_MEGNR
MSPPDSDFDDIWNIVSTDINVTCKPKTFSKAKAKLLWLVLNTRSDKFEKKQGVSFDPKISFELSHPKVASHLLQDLGRCSVFDYRPSEMCRHASDVIDAVAPKRRKSGIYMDYHKGLRINVLYQSKGRKNCHPKVAGVVYIYVIVQFSNFLIRQSTFRMWTLSLKRLLSTNQGLSGAMPIREVVDGREYNEQSDIWSLGCMIYELCSLHPPFQAATHEDLHQRIREARYSHIPVQYSAGLQEIISLMITHEDFLRPSALMVLHHPQLLANTSQLSDTQTYTSTPTTSEYNTPTNSNISNHNKNTPKHENKSLASQYANTSMLNNTHTANYNTEYSTNPYKLTNTNPMRVHNNSTYVANTNNTPLHNSNTPISSTHTSSIPNTYTHIQNTSKHISVDYNSISYERDEHQHQHKQSTGASFTHKDICMLNGNAISHNQQKDSEILTEKNNCDTNPPSSQGEENIDLTDLHLYDETFLLCRNLKITKEQIGIKDEFHEDFSPFKTHTKSKSFEDSHSRSFSSLNNNYCKDLEEKSVNNNAYDQEFSVFKSHKKIDGYQKPTAEDNSKFVEEICKGISTDEAAFEANNHLFFPFITHKKSKAVNEDIIPGMDFMCTKSDCEMNVTKDILQKHNDSNTFAILKETVERINKEVVKDNTEITFGSSELESDLDVSIDFDNCGAKNVCICGGLSADIWQSRLAKIREAEASIRKREIAVEMAERELAKREHKVSQMEREARQHLVRAQIFLRQSRPRSNNATIPQRPASDLDTTVSADVDEMPQTTTKLDPNCIENPFLPLRGVSQVQKQNEKKNVKFKENFMTFKSNTLENPKKLKKQSLVDGGINCKKACDDAAVKYLSTNSNINIISKKKSSNSIDKIPTDKPKKDKETIKIKQKYSNVKSRINLSKFSKKPKESICDKENICSDNIKLKTSKSNIPKSKIISDNIRNDKQRTVAVGSGRVLQFYKAL